MRLCRKAERYIFNVIIRRSFSNSSQEKRERLINFLGTAVNSAQMELATVGGRGRIRGLRDKIRTGSGLKQAGQIGQKPRKRILVLKIQEQHQLALTKKNPDFYRTLSGGSRRKA